MNNAQRRKEKKGLYRACMNNDNNVFVQIVWLGESLSYILSLKGWEAARFDFHLLPESYPEIIL